MIGWWLAKLLKLEQKLGYLISAGTAICGGSAIAAVSPAIKAKDEDIGLALATVFVLNSLALFIFPVIGHALGLDQQTFGTWAAIAIHDTSSVVGAASAYGEEALTTATTLKLARALWIIPVAFVSAFIFRNDSKKSLFLISSCSTARQLLSVTCCLSLKRCMT
ncbi:arginine/ornithine antiporter ArcD [Vibrio ponticus]|nr:arginine/ornithine antiporter ArcD [Vibrio ponticus]